MTAIATIFCRACNKDITNSKRTKSPQGHYFCEDCVAAAKKKKAAAAGVSSPPPPSDDLSLAPLPFAEEPTPVALAPTSSPTTASKKIPSRCPNCNIPLRPNSRICTKCQRDVTQMDKLLALKAQTEAVSSHEKLGNWAGRIFKTLAILGILAIAGFIGYGCWLMFHPTGPFDYYPLSRTEAVKKILADISEGTDKSYADSYMLISTRIRYTNNSHDDAYKAAYTRMHNDFLKKYGPDWLSKAEIESDDPRSRDDVVPYLITINGDEYHIQSQVQISTASGIEQLMTHEDYPEDGKHHFGIRDIQEYSLIPKTKEELEMERFLQEAKNHPNQRLRFPGQ